MSAPLLLWELFILAIALLLTLFGVSRYRVFAVRRGIVARPNFRSLHGSAVPRGGGIVFSTVCLVGVAALWALGLVPPRVGLSLVVGGTAATIVGFIDDVVQIRPSAKLLAQGVLAGFVLLCFDGRPLVDVPPVPTVVELALSWLSLVWLMNAYNFMDGVDGMASSGAVFMAASVIVVMTLGHEEGSAAPDVGLMLICALVALCNLGFLIFNRPTASVFMGDSGSLFLGLVFSVLVVKTVVEGEIGPWTWLIVFGYFAGDTITTSVVRVFVSPKWYGEHRSHAYQNLARIWGSHLKVVLGVSAYHVLWLLPLALWSTRAPSYAPAAAALAFLPVVGWTLRHGPMRSSL
jgi:Fuc2NAc and GlcNAc transferase